MGTIGDGREQDTSQAAEDLPARVQDIQQTAEDLPARVQDTQQTAEDLPARVADVVGEVSEAAEKPRGRTLTSVARDALARATRRGARVTGRGVRYGLRRLAGQVVAMAPRLPVRSQETLRAQFPGRSPDEIADALIESAARGSAAVGATVGVWSVLPIAPTFPAEVASETLTLVGIEIKLIAELHEVYGMRAPGATVDRMTAYVAAWAHRRGVSLTAAPTGLMVAAGSPVRRLLQRRLAARATRNAFSLGPLFTGAIAGAALNRHHTHRLGVDVRNDLRKHSPFAAQWRD